MHDRPSEKTSLLFAQVTALCRRLRDKGGCPWDREQTHLSIKRYLIEECYEVADTIDKGDTEALKEELGDLLYQVIFHAQIAEDNKKFIIDDVLQGLYEKMIRRHPHVFEDLEIESYEDLFHNWDRIKKEENKSGKVPEAFPSLIYAQKTAKKALKASTTEQSMEQHVKQCHESLDSLEDSKGKDSGTQAESLGTLLFHICALAARLDIDAETSLRTYARKHKP